MKVVRVVCRYDPLEEGRHAITTPHHLDIGLKIILNLK